MTSNFSFYFSKKKSFKSIFKYMNININKSDNQTKNIDKKTQKYFHLG